MSDHGQDLRKVLSTLREQLSLAREDGTKSDLKFEISELEVELNVVVTAEGGGKAGVKFWVLTAELNGKYSQVATHKIKLKMKLKDKHGGSTDIGGVDNER